MDGLMDQIFSEDPYLAFQPAFSYTLPIQLLVSGITLTLLCVLAIHLIFTTQYHYPLAPLNYILQFLSILTVLISVFIRIIVILEHSGESGDTWPYSLDYVSVLIPPKSWNLGQDAAWFFLQALNSGFANLAHIQFLTLLFPSHTEARLIVFVLGPLALASAFLVFTALSPSQMVLDLGDAIRNVFNSTLLLIFTIALLIWGLVVNRRRAWRTDGGTAIFGSAAIFLATVNTACNFVAVKEDGIDWLQHLLYCSILWQTWLGWWWWVGSGMGIGEVEDIMERAEKKKRRMAKKAAKQRAANKASRGANNASGNSDASRPLNMRRTASLGVGEASAVAMAGFTSSVTGILRGRTGTLSRRRGSVHEGDGDRGEDGRANRHDIELDDIPRPRPQAPRRQATAPTAGSGSAELSAPQVEFSASTFSGSQGRNQISSNSETSSTSNTPSLNPPRTVGQFLSYPTTWLWVYLRQLRRAHEDAAKKQAIERAERRQKVFGEHGAVKGKERASGADEAELGWGLGAFGIREHEEGERRLQQAGERLRDEQLLPGTGTGAVPSSEGSADQAGEAGDPGPGPSSVEHQLHRRRTSPIAEAADDGAASGAATPTPRPPAPARNTSSFNRANGRIGEEDWTDVDDEDDDDSDSSDSGGRRRRRRRRGSGDAGADGAGSSWSWWGPLKRWRLADRSTF